MGRYSLNRRFRITLKHRSGLYRAIRTAVLGRLLGYRSGWL